MEIMPAILESDWPSVAEKIKLVDGLTDWIQLDVSDGVFTPTQTWNNPQDLFLLKSHFNIEAHLMIENPLAVLDSWFVDQVGRVVIHVESLKNVKPPTFNSGGEVVLGFRIETPWESYRDWVGRVGRVLFLSVEPGRQGQKFDRRVIDKIKSLKSAHPRVKIEVDGGIDSSVAGELKSAGADALVVGSAVFGSGDPKAALENLKKSAG